MRPVTTELLQEITRRLVEQFQPEQVILFGSHAWGTPDVDLLVIVSHSDLSDYERAVLGHQCLSGLDIPKDVVVRTRAEFEFFRPVRAALEHRIAEQGKILYERSQETVGATLANASSE